MTFVAKTGIGSGSPSFTPHTRKQLQSQRNEDSAPQDLNRLQPVQGGAELTNDAPVGAARVPRAGRLAGLVGAPGVAL
jgi:hypothetical protein